MNKLIEIVDRKISIHNYDASRDVEIRSFRRQWRECVGDQREQVVRDLADLVRGTPNDRPGDNVKPKNRAVPRSSDPHAWNGRAGDKRDDARFAANGINRGPCGTYMRAVAEPRTGRVARNARHVDTRIRIDKLSLARVVRRGRFSRRR